MARSRERKQAAKARRGRLPRPPWAWIGGGIAATVVVAAVLAALVSEDDGSADDAGGFQIVAYQGEDILGGDRVDFNSLLGTGTPVVLNFWAGLCPPCRQEMPGFQRVYEEHSGDFTIVGVDVGQFTGLGSQADARDFLAEFEITYPTAFAVDDDALREYGVRSMPTTVFFDGAGNVVSRHAGFLQEDQLRDQIESLIAAES